MLYQRKYPVRKAAGLACMLLCWLVGLAERATASSAPAAQDTSHFAIADFDGDLRPDLATVEASQSGSLDARYSIAFQLSSGVRHTLSITAPIGGLRITSRDVNGDSFLDVVLTTAWTNRPVAVLLNDGHGNFTRSDLPGPPGIAGSSEADWTAGTVGIRDAAVVLGPRCFSGDCEQGGRVDSPRSGAGPLAARSPQNSLLSLAIAFHGRAPPFFDPHI
jgi:hypothetical protein